MDTETTVTAQNNQLQNAGQSDLVDFSCPIDLSTEADEAGVYLQQAEVYHTEGKWEEVVASCQKALKLKPDCIAAYKTLGNAFEVQGKGDAAIQAYHELGVILAREEKWEEAIVAYQRVIEISPESAETYYLLGESRAKLGDMQGAISCYHYAVELAPNYDHKRLLNDLEERKIFRVNAEQLRRIPDQKVTTESLPKITSLKSNQGWVFYGPYINLVDGLYLVKVDFDFPDLTSNTKANPETVGFKFDVVTEGGACIWYECNVCTSQEKIEFTVALVAAQKVEFRFGATGETFSVNYIELTLIHEADTNPVYYSGLGSVLNLQGKQNKASYAHRRAVEMYLESGKHDRALACYQKALEEQPDAYSELGLILVQRGLLNEVIACCERAFNGHHYSATFYYYYNLGILLEEQGFTNEADKLFKRAPHWQLSEGQIYEYIWKGLNQLGALDENSICCQTEINADAVYEHFKQTSQCCRIMEMEALTDEDIFFIENNGLSVVNLKLMRLDSTTLEEFYINSFSAGDHKVELTKKSIRKNGGKTFTWGEMNHKNNFQHTIVETGYIYIFCPFSGKVLKSNHCQLTLGGIFYRFEGAQIFYLFAHSWSGALYGVYFPGIETVIKLKSGFQRDVVTLINSLKADTVSNWKVIKADRVNKHKKIAAVLGITWANLGHYLWNEVTGINFLYENDILDNVDKFCVVYNSNDVYKKFNIVDIFPEITTEKLMLFSDSQSCSNFLIENNYLAVRVTDVFIKEELAGRIYSNAKNKCSKTVLEEVENAKKHFPLIWVNLRSHNKSWRSQTEGYANIINKLYEDYPKIGVVFDGSPSEEVIMDKIVDLIPSTIATYNAIGDVYESIVWAHAIDTYIAVVGSGLTLVTWIANKPGVAHSETAHLSQKLFWSEVRENAVPPVFIHKDLIVDCGHGKMYCNYYLDWNVIYYEVVKIIKGLTENR